MSLYDDLLEEINNKVTRNREEYENNQNKKIKSDSKRRAYNSKESIKALTNNVLPTKKQYMSSESVDSANDLPVANEFRKQLETGKRVEVPEEYALPTFADKIKNKIKNYDVELVKNAPRVVGNIGYGLANGLIDFNSRLTRASVDRSNKYKEQFDKISDEDDLLQKLNQIAVENMDTYDNVSELYNIYNKEKNGGDQFTNKLKEQKQINNQRIQENIENSNNPIAKKMAELTPSIGQMLPSMVPYAGLVYSTGSAQQSYYENAKERGMDEEDAKKYGNIMGSLEGVTEFVGGKLTKAVGKNIAKGTTKQAGKMFALDVLENVGEEAVMEPLSELTTKITGGDQFLKYDYSTTDGWKQLGKDMLDSGIDGGLISIIMGGASAGIGSSINVVNKITKGEKVSTNELNIARQDVQNNIKNQAVEQNIQDMQKVVNNIQNNQDTVSIANNEQTLYNNIESESGINGEIYSRTIGRDGRIENEIANQRGQTNDTTVSQGDVSERFKENRQRSYEEFIEYANRNKVELDTVETENLKQLANNLGINVTLFNGNGTNDYIGMTDKQNPNNVYIDINQKEIRGEDLLYHEFLHSRKRSNDSVYIDKIAPIEQDIVRNYTDIIDDFIREKGLDERYKNYPELVAEEIIADYTSKNLGNLEIDYNLPQFYIEAINEAVNEMTNNVKANNVQESSKIQNKDMETIAPVAENQDSFSSQRTRTLNPTEIANLTLGNANTTPELKQKNYVRGNKESNFLSNITTESGFLNEDLRKEMSTEDNIRYYKGITNEQTLEKAFTELQNGGEKETLKWFSNDNKNVTAEDVAKGWILLKQYQDKGDYQGAVEIAKKMRDMGTNAGQTVQAYNILARLTPEGMFYYAQSELSEAYNKMAQGKSKEWIEENGSKFDLTPEETQFIKEKMESIQGIDNERTKKITLAEIQKVISDKIPPTASQSVKAWMRISMLFNPKTQVRNVLGNAVILPVNMSSDMISSGLDRAIAKKTGVRTTGMTNIKSYAKGFGKGVYESYDDFRRGINTRNIEGNRFEVSEGKSFKDKNIGKALNRVDNLLSFALDVGDRGFYEATFTNSINNQLALNNTTEVTQNMIDIATNEALQRTWQDNNAYTSAVLKIRNILNLGKGYGLGDVLIPFAKTPANLTKAIVDYSPVGLAKTLAVDARKFKNSLENGQYTPQMQHQFVQNFGKGMAGSFLYVLGYALAKAGIATGESDDDKDVKNFMKNSLGISSYSLKIGDKTFTYDWAQPVATPLAIMTNYVKYSKDNPDANALEKIWKSMNIGTEQLLQQSFMESLNTVLNGNGITLENLSQSILELPARAIPTFSKQIADMIDPTQRTSFEYNEPFKSAVNSVKAKIPFLSSTLPVARDTLGNEIKKYGGDNSLWNVMFNPANMNKGKLSKAGEEIYKVYMQTGDTTIFPRVAPYYINSKGDKLNMTSYQRSEFQKVSGKYVESALNGLLNNKDYKKLSNEKKANIIKQIVSDSYSKAKYDILNIDSKEYEKLRNTLDKVSTSSYYDYKFKTKDMKKDSEKIDVVVNSNYSAKEKTAIYENYIKEKDDKNYELIKSTDLNINTYLKYKLADSNKEFNADKKDDGTVKGLSIKSGDGSAKDKRYNYIKDMDATYIQKAILFGLIVSPSKTDKSTIVNYISSLEGKTNKEKLDMLGRFSWIKIYKDGTFDF